MRLYGFHLFENLARFPCAKTPSLRVAIRPLGSCPVLQHEGYSAILVALDPYAQVENAPNLPTRLRGEPILFTNSILKRRFGRLIKPAQGGRSACSQSYFVKDGQN